MVDLERYDITIHLCIRMQTIFKKVRNKRVNVICLVQIILINVIEEVKNDLL